MGGLKSFATLLISMLFCFSAQATSESEVIVKLGKGRAEVQSYGFEFPGNWRQKMETDLMTDRNLADRRHVYGAPSPSALSSAARNCSFSSRRPVVTRR